MATYCAAISAAAPLVVGLDVALIISLPLSIAWLAITIGGIANYGKKATWSLLALPLAALWPVGLGTLYFACGYGDGCVI